MPDRSALGRWLIGSLPEQHPVRQAFVLPPDHGDTRVLASDGAVEVLGRRAGELA